MDPVNYLVANLRRSFLLLALPFLALSVAACDGPSLPIPPTPTAGTANAGTGHGHVHGEGGSSNARLVTKYGGAMGVNVISEPEPPQAGSPFLLTYEIKAGDGKPVTPDKLLVTHERLMHLIVVNRDLSFFTHVHPQDKGEGRYSVEERLPNPGTYLLFNEFYGTDGEAQIERDVLVTEGMQSSDVDPALQSTIGLAQEADGLAATLTTDARKVRRRASTTFMLNVQQGDKPVIDLEPFLGAPAHVVIISADTKQFAHTHADLPGGTMSGDMGGMNMGTMQMPTPAARFGPNLQFTHTFMQPGFYRVWVQTGYKGKVVTFANNIEVVK